MADKKVLVIEDRPMNRELVIDLLEAAGYIVLPAENAEQGIERARTEVPDLILMDIGLPGMEGLTATKKLKQDEKTRNIPVVALMFSVAAVWSM